MKTILLTLVLIFGVTIPNNLYSQITNKAILNKTEKFVNNKLHKMPVLSVDKQFSRMREVILQQYGPAFKYSNQIYNDTYEFSLENYASSTDRKRAVSINNYQAVIIDITQNKIIDKLKILNTYDDNGNLFISFDPKDISRLLDKSKLQKPSPMYITTLCNLVVKDSILEDQEIIKDMNIPEAYWTKILNKTYTTSYLLDQNGNQSVLFNLCVGGIFIPLGTNGQNSKVLALDNGFHSILYFDANQLFDPNEPFNECYGYGGTDYGQFYNPTGMVLGRVYNNGFFQIYPIFIADYANNRIIEVNYETNLMNPNQMGNFDNNSYNIFISIHNPYDVAYFEDYTNSQNTYDKIWTSQENVENSHLICIDNTGNKVQNFIGYKEHFTGLSYYFNEAEDIRLSCSCGSLIFVDKSRNRIVSCHLDSLGLGTQFDTTGGSLIEAMDVIDFCTNDTVNSVQIQVTDNFEWPYVWVTSGSYIHLVKLDEVSCVSYLASANKPKNTDYSFSNLLNTISANGAFDMVTVESWNCCYGLRKYLPYCDVYQDSLQSYCLDSTDRMRYMAIFTNDCYLKIYAYRWNNAIGGWQQVIINKLNNNIINDSTVIKYQLAGQDQSDNGRNVDLQLDLPLQDYVFGGQIQMAVKLYPTYSNPYDPSNYNYNEKFYFTDIKKTCKPKPGGCPNIYILDTTGTYRDDNNILHRSEFTEFSGQDIMDRYEININPLIDASGNIQIAIIENENDSSILDEAKLYYIDHPISITVGVTENNDIVYYNDSDVISTDLAYLNNNKITSLIQYNTQTGIKGYINDSIYAHYPNLNSTKGQKNFISKSDIKNSKSSKGIDNSKFESIKNNRKSDNKNLNTSITVQNNNKKSNLNNKQLGKNKKASNVGGPGDQTDSIVPTPDLHTVRKATILEKMG